MALHMEHLELANEVRRQRKELKRQITAREITVTDVVQANEPLTRTMPVSALLLAQPHWGASRVRRLLKSIPMSEWVTVGDLTDRQRAEIADQLWFIDSTSRHSRRAAA